MVLKGLFNHTRKKRITRLKKSLEKCDNFIQNFIETYFPIAVNKNRTESP